MNAPDAYRAFLEAKIAAPPSMGLPCELDEVRSHLVDGRITEEQADLLRAHNIEEDR